MIAWQVNAGMSRASDRPAGLPRAQVKLTTPPLGDPAPDLGRLAGGWLERSFSRSPQKLSGHDHPLDLVRTFIYLGDLCHAPR
jgi:hypothetical protein